MGARLALKLVGEQAASHTSGSGRASALIILGLFIALMALTLLVLETGRERVVRPGAVRVGVPASFP